VIVLEGTPASWNPPAARSAVAIGVFDGVHLGHRTVLEALEGGDPGGWKVALTFGTHPQALLHPDRAPLPLTTLARRLELLDAAGVDAVAVLGFDEKLRRLSPSAFVDRFLVAGLNAGLVVVGEGFRFGNDAAGDTSTLKRLGDAAGFSVITVPILGADGREYRSTAIRTALADGEVSSAAGMLGRPHEVVGVVVHGDGRGRQIGVPTANLELLEPVAVPARGVYVVTARVHAEQVPGVANVGVRPTFDGESELVEVHLLDHDEDLYGCEVQVRFLARLRGERRFESVGDLVDQIGRDIAAARVHFSSAPIAKGS